MPTWQVILLGLIEGVTEFLPVSSTGHLLLTEHFLDVCTPGKTFEGNTRGSLPKSARVEGGPCAEEQRDTFVSCFPLSGPGLRAVRVRGVTSQSLPQANAAQELTTLKCSYSRLCTPPNKALDTCMVAKLDPTISKIPQIPVPLQAQVRSLKG